MNMIRFKCISGMEIVMPVAAMMIEVADGNISVFNIHDKYNYDIGEEEYKRLCDIIGV